MAKKTSLGQALIQGLEALVSTTHCKFDDDYLYGTTMDHVYSPETIEDLERDRELAIKALEYYAGKYAIAEYQMQVKSQDYTHEELKVGMITSYTKQANDALMKLKGTTDGKEE